MSKTFFVTSANSGLVFAIAKAASAANHKVLGTGRSKTSAASLGMALPAVHPAMKGPSRRRSPRSFFGSATRSTSGGRFRDRPTGTGTEEATTNEDRIRPRLHRVQVSSEKPPN
ncbi:hypothetical protein AB3G45_20370 [Shinella sp. S4-D37]|uniref:hypothetical protein n=1 Tax=Shinella sp. S4-D37 TaxID=3161999 RepID=UPI003465457B